jgi:hypothetical protein
MSFEEGGPAAAASSVGPIYVITVFGDVIKGRPKRQRTWGWYSKAEDARRAVLKNHTDMYETIYYDVALIEEVHDGILAFNRPRWWFSVKEGPGEGNDSWLHPIVTEINTPDWAKQTFGWGMG